MQPSAILQDIGDRGVFDAGIGQDRGGRQHLLDGLQIGHLRCFAGDLARDQHGVGDRGKDRATRPVGQGAPVEAVGKLGGDVIEHREVLPAQPVAVAHRLAGIGGPRPHVRGIGAGEDFAHKGGAGGGGKRDGGYADPRGR